MIHGGKSYVSSPPAFSNDAKRLLVATGNTVSIFSTSTGMLINELEGHNALVTSIIVVPSSSKVITNCWTASLDGTIRYWDFSVPELIKTVDIHLPIYSMVIPSLFTKPKDEAAVKAADVFAYVSVEDSSKTSQPNPRWEVRKCNLTASKLVNAMTITKAGQPLFLIASPSGEYFGVQMKQTLFIWKVPAHDSKSALAKKMKLHHTKILTTFAFHPNERIVAAGDITGRVLVWRGFGSRTFRTDKQSKSNMMKYEEEKPGVRGDGDAESCTTWHWHSSEVKFVSFSSDGSYLYSGGNEGVLVLWQLETGNKKFLPRIGAALLYFVQSPDPTLSAISCADNQIHLSKMSSLEVFKSIAGIKLPCSLPDMWDGLSSGICFDQSAGLVVLPTENYRIQFYSLFDNHEILEVQICERNHQSSDDITVVVSLVALSNNGSLMTTVETRLSEDGVGGLVCMKFWACETPKKNVKLTTIVYEPHRDAGISAIAFHPSCKMVVSTSCGGDFKIWVHRDRSQSTGQDQEYSGWVCHSVGSYKGKSMTSAAFSADGSVLAVAAETVITLWDPDRNYLVAVMGETCTPIASLSFLGNSEYLLSSSHGSSPQLSLWCASSLSRTWSYNIFIQAVACMEDNSSFAVLALFPADGSSEAQGTQTFSGDGFILLFDGYDPAPVATWFVRKATGGGLAFVQANQLSSPNEGSSAGLPSHLLAYVNCDHEYVVFDPNRRDGQEVSWARKVDAGNDEKTGRFGYTSMYGDLPEFDLQRTSQTPTVPSERPWENIFNGPSHTLPPLTKLCSAFLESLLERRTILSG